MKHRAPSRSNARAVVAGGMMAAGACALFNAAPAQAAPPPPPNPFGSGPNPFAITATATAPNGNPQTPSIFTGFTGFVPTWAKGTYNTITCPGGVCFIPDSQSPFPSATNPSASQPIVANPNGTGTSIGLSFI
jgi:hypothetical protein